MIWIKFIIAFIVMAVFFAKMEISAEGKNGYASKFPCKKWRKGLLKRMAGGRPYLAEYHLWLVGFWFLMFHFPFFSPAWACQWGSYRTELFVLGQLLVFIVLEDWLWFALNPDFGIKNFKKSPKIWWHPKWILFAPDFYWLCVPLGAGLIILSQII